MDNVILIGFGDSWAHGSGLDQTTEKPYLTLLAESRNVRHENYAVTSSSAAHMLLQFQTFLNQSYNPENRYLAIFFITAKERSLYFDDTTEESINISPCTPSEGSTYYRYYNDKLGDFELNKTILALQQMCKVYSIQDIWIPGWQQLHLWPAVNFTKFVNNAMPITTLFSADNHFYPLTNLLNSDQRSLYFTKCGHPNQLGHRLIADVLDKHIIDNFQ